MIAFLHGESSKIRFEFVWRWWTNEIFQKAPSVSLLSRMSALNWHSTGIQRRGTDKGHKIKRQNPRKEIVAYFGVSLGTVQRYWNTMDSIRYVGSDGIRYQEYDENIDITSVMIPISRKYLRYSYKAMDLAAKDQNLDFGREKIKINSVDAIGIINRSTTPIPSGKCLPLSLIVSSTKSSAGRTSCLISTPRSRLAPITLAISKSWMWWSR